MQGQKVSGQGSTMNWVPASVSGSVRTRTYAGTPAAAVEDAQAVIMMMWDKKALDSVLTGDDGLFAAAQKGQIFIDMSTQLPETALWEAGQFALKGAHFLDAPVHGSKGEAFSGGLWIMAGGDKSVYEQASELFDCIGETHHYMGEQGRGSLPSSAVTIWSRRS